ncbi:hypothetical protein [Geoalkalibacter subterraneus]|uniref:Uncharacterized protein n=1 Tax=Geoalkalibacter subterraneus TaxID=483547 RepID=A0A0B5FVJ8_9BACT|nr:hypothetical protein [Geoalkalibacter subterraneus]AJF08195.1 hypothetical protein GSUB_17025 [Geoalkalibacter subterraneus]
MSDWKKFTGKEPLSGVFWVRGLRQEVDCDVDDYGRPVWHFTDEQSSFLALVEISFDPAEDLDVCPVNQYLTGDFDEQTDSITHYKEFAMPEGPAV